MGEFKVSCHFTTLVKKKQVMKLTSFGNNGHTKQYPITRYYAN